MATAFNYAVFWVCLHGFRIFYLFSSWIGYFAGVLLGYLLNAKYTFDAVRSVSIGNLVAYGSIYLLSLVLSSLTLVFMVKYLGIRPEISNVVAIAQSTTTKLPPMSGSPRAMVSL